VAASVPSLPPSLPLPVALMLAWLMPPLDVAIAALLVHAPGRMPIVLITV
jgi:hypothetical protein